MVCLYEQKKPLKLLRMPIALNLTFSEKFTFIALGQDPVILASHPRSIAIEFFS